ncbi:MAG: hypothetical protein M0C28_46255 [Candidatus Moduliflexus flocculans]|nr:hypothetical protein [Candidatus Moduliflexus flocculans]
MKAIGLAVGRPVEAADARSRPWSAGRPRRRPGGWRRSGTCRRRATEVKASQRAVGRPGRVGRRTSCPGSAGSVLPTATSASQIWVT